MAASSSLQSTIPMAREVLCSAFFVPCRSSFVNPFRKYRIPTNLLSKNTINSLQFNRDYTEKGGSLIANSSPKPFQSVRSPGLVALEYSDLNLPHSAYEEWGHVRIRQHVNPLNSSFLNPVEVPDWNEVFKDANLPLMVDIGSGSGRFLMWLAKRNPHTKNYLGLEIRKKCPDPHFKKKHHKRRVLQKPLVDSIVDSIAPGGQVFIQSDVLEVALDMRNHFDAESDKIPHIDTINSSVLCDDKGWLLSNPMGIRTEREIHAESDGAKIYRRMYHKLI